LEVRNVVTFHTNFTELWLVSFFMWYACDFLSDLTFPFIVQSFKSLT
jgi:hypothetical protein